MGPAVDFLLLRDVARIFLIVMPCSAAATLLFLLPETTLEAIVERRDQLSRLPVRIYWAIAWGNLFGAILLCLQVAIEISAEGTLGAAGRVWLAVSLFGVFASGSLRWGRAGARRLQARVDNSPWDTRRRVLEFAIAVALVCLVWPFQFAMYAW